MVSYYLFGALAAQACALVIVPSIIIAPGPGELVASEKAEKYAYVKSSIFQDTLWNAQTIYILENKIFVGGSATLSIEPGTKIMGKSGSALIVTRDAKIYARGTRESPIVFSSNKPEA